MKREPNRPGHDPVQKLGPTSWTSLGIGATAGMVIAGLAARLEPVFAGRGLTGRSLAAGVLGAGLLAVAVGVRVPQRLAVWACVWAYARFVRRGRSSDPSRVYLSPSGSDRPVWWVVLSVIALATGASTALLPVSIRWGEAAYAWALDHFLWSFGPLVVLQAVIALAIGLIPLALLGLAVSSLHHLSCPDGRWATRATGWTLVGAAAGTVASGWVGRGAAQGDLIVIAAALPALAVSLIAAVSGAARSDGAPERSDGGRIPLPTWSERRPGLLRFCVVLVGIVGAGAALVWEGYLSTTGPDATALAVAMILAAMGIGVGAGSRPAPLGPRSAGGFGLACAAAAVIVTGSTVGMVSTRPWAATAAWWGAGATTAAVGWVAGYGWRTLLSRAANRSDAGVMALTRTLAGAAMMVWLGVPLAERLSSRPVILMLLAIVLLGTGGVLVVHEPGGSRRTHRLRLGAVLGAMTTMLVAAWLAPQGRRPPDLPTTHASPTSVARPDPETSTSRAPAHPADP